LPPPNADGKPDLYAAGTFEFVPQETGTPHGAIAYLVPEGTVGNQGNHTGTLGLDFDVNVAIKVTKLGVFDSDSDGLARPIQARLYDRDAKESLAQISFTTAEPGELVGGSRMKPLDTPLSLPAGFHGSMVAGGYGPDEPDGNQFGGVDLDITTDDGGCAISFVGTGRFGALPAAFPTFIDGGPANRYAAGTFEFEVEGGPPVVKLSRGDVDQNGQLQLTDAVQVLGYLFLGTVTKVPECLDAADSDDNGVIQLTDAVRILGFLFLGTAALPPPFSPPGPRCGPDPTVGDGLDCKSFNGCP
jgi:hypothetical protein